MQDHEKQPTWHGGNTAVERRLARLSEAAPPGFAARIMRTVGVPVQRYDLYVHVQSPVEGLYVAFDDGNAVCGSALASQVDGPRMFEEAYRARTGRSVLRAVAPPPGLTSALRTRRTTRLVLALRGLTDEERAVLDAVRTIPPGQLRPVSWVAHTAGGRMPPDAVAGLLARNPAPVLVPCHRVQVPGDQADSATGTGRPYPPRTGRALRFAEGIDLDRVGDFTAGGITYLGSDTTRVYCHPTCAHARRISPAHQVPFRSAREAVASGYRACRSCRPAAV